MPTQNHRDLERMRRDDGPHDWLLRPLAWAIFLIGFVILPVVVGWLESRF